MKFYNLIILRKVLTEFFFVPVVLTEAEQRLCSEALTSEVGLLQHFRAYKKWIPLAMEKKSFLSKESDTKISQSMYFAYEVGIISSYSNRIHI